MNMADPKYADLPGIAHDEPDVYETSDLPESEQTADFYEKEDETVEKIYVSVDDAFNKFKGKHLNTSNVDFSERIGRKIRTGYKVSSGDWELVGTGDKETPIQKYNRLQCEMQELLEEVKDLQQTVQDDNTNFVVSTEQVEQALKQITDLKLENILGEQVVSKLSDPQGTQIRKLLSQLEQYRASIHEKPESETEFDESGIIYQFSYKPEHARLAQTARLAELESRLHRLETVLGASSDKLSRLTTATSKGSLLEVAENLSATASLLDSSQLDHIEGRLNALSQKLTEITEKKNQVQQDDEKDQMILELYEIIKKSENTFKILPQTIERLKALQELHSKATSFTKTLTEIEAMQAEISGNVENNKVLLQGVQESFATSLIEINNTVQSLDARIKALKK